MDAVVRAVGALLERLGEFFDMFDLSFFVSGGTFVLGVAWILHGEGAWNGELGTLTLVAGLLMAYVVGLACFAIGRWMRRMLFGPWGSLGSAQALQHDDPPVSELGHPTLGFSVARHLRALGLDDDFRFASAFRALDAERRASQERGSETWTPASERRFAKLYARMWGELREIAPDGLTYRLLRSYWVRAATLDGLVIALVPWWIGLRGVLASPACGVVLGERSLVASLACHGVSAVFLGAVVTLFLMREASRFDRYQVEELTGFYAVKRDLARAKQEAVWSTVDGLERERLLESLVGAAIAAEMPAFVETVLRRLGGKAGPSARLYVAVVVATRSILRRQAETVLREVRSEHQDDLEPEAVVLKAVERLRRQFQDNAASMAEQVARDPQVVTATEEG